jgi:hypothetical protein
VSFNDPGDEVTGRHPPRKRRRAAKTIDPMQSDLLHGTSATPQPPRDKSRGERRKDWVLDEFHEKRHADRLLFLREKLKELYRTRLKHVQWVPSLRDSNNGRLIPTWKWTGA